MVEGRSAIVRVGQCQTSVAHSRQEVTTLCDAPSSGRVLLLLVPHRHSPATPNTSADSGNAARDRCARRPPLVTPSCCPRSGRQRFAAGLSAELPQVQREALLLPSADDEAGLLDQPLRGSSEMHPPASRPHRPFNRFCQRLRHGSVDRSCSMNSRRPPGLRIRRISLSA